MKKEPTSYDVTFCVSKCKDKCWRHTDNYEFAPDILISMADFDCENKKGEKRKQRNG